MDFSCHASASSRLEIKAGRAHGAPVSRMVPTGPRADQDLNQNKARSLTGASPAVGVPGVSSSNTKVVLMSPAVAIDLWPRRSMDDSNEGHVGRIDASTGERPPQIHKLFSLNQPVRYRSGSKTVATGGAGGALCVHGEPEWPE